MTQMLTRIAITFQSTYWKASISLMMPIQTMTVAPSMAATALSTTLLITTRIVITNTASASHCIMSMERDFLIRRFG